MIHGAVTARRNAPPLSLRSPNTSAYVKIALLQNPARPLAPRDRKDLLALLKGHRVVSRDTPRTCSSRDRLGGADLVIAVGGDGSVLSAAHLVRGRGIPVLGFNTGHVGFLAGITLANFREELPHILSGRCVTEDRVTLRVEMPSGRSGWAMNDVAFQVTGRDLFAASLFLNGRPVCDFKGDGLVVATATGATAYNFSLGGPLLAPDGEMIAVTPKAPLTLTNRSLVLNAPKVLAFRMTGGPTRVDADSGVVGVVRAGDTVYVHRSPVTVPIVFPARHNHFVAVGQKLRWNDQSITR